jgi:ABC-type amino acid transport substrate-binding protein
MKTSPATRRLGIAAVAVSLAALSACGSDGSSSGADGDSDAAAGSKDKPAAFSTLDESVQSKGVVTLGALWETPPVISVTADDTSTPVGIAPDIASALAPMLGVDMEWKNMQWPAQLPGVQSGQVDVLFGQVSDTAEREASVVDIVPFTKMTMSLLMSADSADSVTSLSDLCGEKVGVPVGSVQAEEVAATSKEVCGDDEIEVESYQGATLAINAVKAGSIAAWLDSTNSQDEAAKADSDLAAVTVPEDEIAPQYTGIAVSKKLPGLTNALVASMKELVADGSYDKILADYDASGSAVTADEVKANPLTGTPVGSTN